MIKVAEAKLRSPHDGVISTLPLEALLRLAIAEGDWISVHTEAPWGGFPEAIKIARSMTTKPILAKGIHASNDSIHRAFDYGANYVLCVGRDPHIKNVIIEPTVLCAYSYAPMVLWNRRNLETGLRKVDNWQDVRKIYKGFLGCGSFGPPFPSDADFCLYSIRPNNENNKTTRR